MRNLSQYQNLIYRPNYVTNARKEQVLKYLATLYPIWEMRYSKSNPPPNGEPNRQLLRPVYWLGNWQFACLNYYHPPQGTQNRCVSAEPYPPILSELVSECEQLVHRHFSPKDVPDRWHLNTCLINFYGNKISDDQAVDCARVGEHKDFEPGPVASLSFGEKALFQFVSSAGKASKSEVILQQWLDDGCLQIFGGEKFKKKLFHRVQRVESKGIIFNNLHTTHFETRRINFTFRYVPDEHIRPYHTLPTHLRDDVRSYVGELAQHSAYWRDALEAEPLTQ